MDRKPLFQKKQLGNWEHECWEKVNAGTKPFPETEYVLGKLAAEYGIALITNTQAQQESDKHRI